MCAELKTVQEELSAAVWCWLMVSKFRSGAKCNLTMHPVDIKDVRIIAV